MTRKQHSSVCYQPKIGMTMQLGISLTTFENIAEDALDNALNVFPGIQARPPAAYHTPPPSLRVQPHLAPAHRPPSSYRQANPRNRPTSPRRCHCSILISTDVFLPDSNGIRTALLLPNCSRGRETRSSPDHVGKHRTAVQAATEPCPD